MTTKPLKEHETGQVAPCKMLDEDGKHHFLPSYHRKDYKFWVSQCEVCGWIDTESIYNEVKSQIVEQILGMESMKKELDGIDAYVIDEEVAHDNWVRNQLRLEIKEEINKL